MIANPSTAPQRKLVLDDSSLCVLLTINGLRETLPGYDEDDVLACCLDHTLDWSFDLGMQSRLLVRVLPSSLAFFRQCGGTRRRGLPWAEVCAEMLRGTDATKPWIESCTLRLLWNCSSSHVLALVEDGELEVMPGTEWRRGPGGSAKVTRPSALDFLKRRRL